MTTFEKLSKRFKNELGLELTDFRRTYAGRNMKAQAAFVWEARLGIKTFGSTYTATELLKSKYFSIMYCGSQEYEIFPEDDKPKHLLVEI